MQTFVAAMALLAFSCCVAPAAALDRDEMLKVVGTVHSDYHILVSNEEEAATRRNNCQESFSRYIQPVCGSNGKKYINMEHFNYIKCLVEAEDDEELELVDMEFCKDAELEDRDSEKAT
ncbi:hypothetical protein BBJ28_00016053 [Nothophytophthora sp. Chile5]|nr:hypothetical protein BBJ28_00016053 [Nothophytophthora sp. Chile5]